MKQNRVFGEAYWNFVKGAVQFWLGLLGILVAIVVGAPAIAVAISILYSIFS